MMGCHAILPVGLLTFGAIACSNPGPEVAHEFELRTEGGAVIATTRGGPKYDGELFTYQQILELRGDSNRPESLLFRPSGMVRSPDGTYFVADSGNQRIAAFDENGEFLRSFGREGEGPGEFRWMVELRWHDGRLIVRDALLRRSYVFSPEGHLLDSVTNPIPFFSRIPDVWRSPNGQIVVLSRLHERASIESGTEQASALVLSAIGDTVAVVDAPAVRTSHRYPAGNYQLSAPIYYSGASVCRYYHDRGLAVTSGEEPVLEWYSLDGSLARRVVLEIPAQPVSPQQRDAISAFLDQQVADSRPGATEGSGELCPEMAIGLRNHAQFADHVAFWDWLMVDAEGYTWLQLPFESGALSAKPATEKQRLLSPEGEYLGITQWPVADRVTWIQDGLMMAILVEDDTGLAVPTVLQIQPLVVGLVYP